MSLTLNSTYTPFLSPFSSKFWALFIAAPSDFPLPDEPAPPECNPYISPIHASTASLKVKVFVGYWAIVLLYGVCFFGAMDHAIRRIMRTKRDVLRAIISVPPEDREREIERLCEIYQTSKMLNCGSQT
ncbi:hypothetical protein VTL71DRAFT_14088 [Oculimacula yallundae]|uniref:Uncharacterized protein n=1 Tax=Oculimacula yallundae TaxID=86028 RepID=A0ABR4CJU5_9HELO